jgi:hypothetical protein
MCHALQHDCDWAAPNPDRMLLTTHLLAGTTRLLYMECLALVALSTTAVPRDPRSHAESHTAEHYSADCPIQLQGCDSDSQNPAHLSSHGELCRCMAAVLMPSAENPPQGYVNRKATMSGCNCCSNKVQASPAHRCCCACCHTAIPAGA